jgi:hypothetical protein
MFDRLNMVATAFARGVSPPFRRVKALISRIAVGLTVYATLALPLGAAELSEGNFGNTVIMTGNIEKGDYIKLRRYIDEHAFTNSILLASLGGNVVEAIRIGRLMRKLKFETKIPSLIPNLPKIIIPPPPISKENFVCASACFFIFVAGVHRITITDFDDDVPYLGVHRPFLTAEDLAALTANDAIESASQLRLFVETYLKDMDVPAKYVELIFSVPNEQIRWITGAEFHSDLAGYIPGLKEWIEVVCDRATLDRDPLVDKEVEEYIRNHPLGGTPPAKAEAPPTERPTPEVPKFNIDRRSFCDSDELSHLSREAYLKEFRH